MQTFPCPYLKGEVELTESMKDILPAPIQICCPNFFRK